MSRTSLPCTAAMFLCASLMRPGGALAEEGDLRVIVMSFEGSGGKTARNAIIKKLATVEGLDLISRKQATSVGESLGIPADTTKPKNLVKIGMELGVDAMVTGTVFSEKNLKNLEITVIFTEDPSMSFTKNYTWKGKAPGADLVGDITLNLVIGIKDTVALIQKQKQSALVQATPVVTEPVAPPPEEKKKKKKKKKKKRPSKGDRGPVIGLHAGMLVGARKLKIETTSGLMVEYDGGAFPAIGINLAFFPIRLATSSPVSGLGLGASFRHSFALESKMEGATDAETYKTYMRALDIRLIYQLILPGKPLVLDFSAGWGFLFYQLTVPATLPESPIVDYEYLNILIGVAAAITAVDPYLVIHVGADLRIPHAFGDANSSYSNDSSGFGGTFKLALSGRIVAGFGWMAGFDYTGLSVTHKGPCATCTYQGTKSKDHHLAGSVMLGYTW